MQYGGVAWVVALLTLLILLVSARLLADRHWLLGWVRGTLGLVFLAVAGVAGVVAYDLFSYRPLQGEAPLVTLSFQADGAQRYRVDLREGNDVRSVTLEGDLWQLDARLFKWKGLAALIGLEPGYRLDRLSGRFLAIEQQQLARHTEATLEESPFGIDAWRWLRLSMTDLMLFDPQALRVTFLPMADDAAYDLYLTSTGLLAKPANTAAEQALKGW